MSGPVVFAGPSVYRRRLDDGGIRFRPPVRRGDLDALLAEPDAPTHVGIVDGAFLHALALPPKEVLRALDAGIHVYGSSSLGALRAVECERYGMVGVGRIFAEYASGRIDEDDEVAMTYDPDSLRPLSEPLVSLRLALADGVAGGAVPAAAASCFLAAGKRLYFPDRTVPAILRAAPISPEDARRLHDFFAG
jgi:hypothetical protein